MSKTAHELLTDEGCYTHVHYEADFDDGDAENGPGSGGHDEYDEYNGDSHYFIFQRGNLVHSGLIDWDEVRFFEQFPHD